MNRAHIRQIASAATPDLIEQLNVALVRERSDRVAAELALGRTRAQPTRALEILAGTQAGEQRARHLAFHDDLTSLPNRRLFLQRLAEGLARSLVRNQSMAVFFVDLDGFKQINDQHGHQAGDRLLRIVAARMRNAVREAEIVGRIGGDEFGCLVFGAPGRDQLRRVACKLFGSICAPMTIDRQHCLVRPSIGIALFPDDAATPESLLEHADAAMYRAKRQQSGYAFVGGAGMNDVVRHPSQKNSVAS